MDETSFIEAVERRTGHGDPTALRRAAAFAVRTLGSHLGGIDHGVADVLPEILRAELEIGVGRRSLEPAEVYHQVSAFTGTRPGVALEIVQSVIAEISCRLSEPQRATLRRTLGEEWAQLIVEPRPESRLPPPRIDAEPEDGHTLASGRPGSAHPVSDCGPVAGQRDSVAAAPDPHSDTKLSSTHGVSAERTGRTLARGRPGSRKPVSDAD